ncbi:MAG TPA: glycine zipper 2TM domain-containing protein [Usitatibacter sp.]|nr:glycine zipper 2TM domain-containing protein [Usitatibacter sp.]
MRTRHWLAAATAAAVGVLAAGCAEEQPYRAGEPGPGFVSAPAYPNDHRYYDASDAHYYPTRYDSGEGRVVAIDPVHDSHRASGGGALLGGIAGAVLGHQIGSGRGNTAATVAGGVGGAVAGNEIEKRHGGSDYYRVTVRFRDGREATFDEETIGDLHVGDRVHVDNGRVFRD